MPNKTIAGRYRGSQHGPITRLIDPAALCDELKPFIFLDFFNAPVQRGFGFPMHPHSGIATLTWQPGSDVRYQDTTGKNGVLKAGGLEWMIAGGGAWHQGSFDTEGLATGFQLWVPMPAGVEDGESFGQYVPPSEVPKLAIEGGVLTLLLGRLSADGQEIGSPVTSHQDMNYFVLDLQAQAGWRYTPPAGHDVAWAFVFEGEASIAGIPTSREMTVLNGEGDIAFAGGYGPARILIGSARRHPHELVMGSSSVHTNAESLQKGYKRIRAIRQSLVQQGLLRR
jgi:redox-sensitive bicupin YhaK (pirin superfamily)